MNRSVAPLSDMQLNRTLSLMGDLRSADLKEICRSLGLTVGGRKAELQNRISDFLVNCRVSGDNSSCLAVRDLILCSYHKEDLPDYETLLHNYQESTQKSDDDAHKSILARQIHIYFKKSPFYTLKRMVSADGNAQILARKHPKGRGTVRFTFKLRQSELKMLESSPNMRLYLVSGAINDLNYTRTQSEDRYVEFPQPIKIIYNNKVLSDNVRGIRGQLGSAKPADLTPYLQKHRRNAVDLVFAYTTRNYLMHLYIVEVTPVEDLMDNILKRPHIPPQSTIAMIKEDAEGEDMVASKEIVSLKCPCSFMRMEYPCRSQKCEHIQCFDCYSFLTLQEQAPTWLCPICSKKIKLSSLAIDDYFLNIIQNSGADVESVELYRDGSWLPNDLQSNLQKIRHHHSPQVSVKEEEKTIPADHSGDEIEVIDLNSDTEEEEPPANSNGVNHAGDLQQLDEEHPADGQVTPGIRKDSAPKAGEHAKVGEITPKAGSDAPKAGSDVPSKATKEASAKEDTQNINQQNNLPNGNAIKSGHDARDQSKGQPDASQLLNTSVPIVNQRIEHRNEEFGTENQPIEILSDSDNEDEPMSEAQVLPQAHQLPHTSDSAQHDKSSDVFEDALVTQPFERESNAVVSKPSEDHNGNINSVSQVPTQLESGVRVTNLGQEPSNMAGSGSISVDARNTIVKAVSGASTNANYNTAKGNKTVNVTGADIATNVTTANNGAGSVVANASNIDSVDAVTNTNANVINNNYTSNAMTTNTVTGITGAASNASTGTAIVDAASTHGNSANSANANAATITNSTVNVTNTFATTANATNATGSVSHIPNMASNINTNATGTRVASNNANYVPILPDTANPTNGSPYASHVHSLATFPDGGSNFGSSRFGIHPSSAPIGSQPSRNGAFQMQGKLQQHHQSIRPMPSPADMRSTGSGQQQQRILPRSLDVFEPRYTNSLTTQQQQQQQLTANNLQKQRQYQALHLQSQRQKLISNNPNVQNFQQNGFGGSNRVSSAPIANSFPMSASNSSSVSLPQYTSHQVPASTIPQKRASEPIVTQPVAKMRHVDAIDISEGDVDNIPPSERMKNMDQSFVGNLGFLQSIVTGTNEKSDGKNANPKLTDETANSNRKDDKFSQVPLKAEIFDLDRLVERLLSVGTKFSCRDADLRNSLVHNSTNNLLMESCKSELLRETSISIINYLGSMLAIACDALSYIIQREKRNCVVMSWMLTKYYKLEVLFNARVDALTVQLRKGSRYTNSKWLFSRLLKKSFDDLKNTREGSVPSAYDKYVAFQLAMFLKRSGLFFELPCTVTGKDRVSFAKIDAQVETFNKIPIGALPTVFFNAVSAHGVPISRDTNWRSTDYVDYLKTMTLNNEKGRDMAAYAKPVDGSRKSEEERNYLDAKIREESRAKLEAELKEKERREAEKKENERFEYERKERERLESQRKEKERLETERKEKDRLEAERKEKDRLEAERKEKERIKAERKKKERLEAERKEKERLEAERKEKERLEAERKEKERLKAERKKKERLEAERKEKERLEAERKEKERLKAEQKEKKRLEAERKEKERLKAEQKEKKRLEAKRKEEERMEAEARKKNEERARLEASRAAEEKKVREKSRAKRAELERKILAKTKSQQDMLNKWRFDILDMKSKQLEQSKVRNKSPLLKGTTGGNGVASNSKTVSTVVNDKTTHVKDLKKPSTDFSVGNSNLAMLQQLQKSLAERQQLLQKRMNFRGLVSKSLSPAVKTDDKQVKKKHSSEKNETADSSAVDGQKIVQGEQKKKTEILPTVKASASGLLGFSASLTGFRELLQRRKSDLDGSKESKKGKTDDEYGPPLPPPPGVPPNRTAKGVQ
ncbi:hypothetical protein BRETT_005068 [Brettanomyces bruxellensis]|uniref:Uncharacterized protein n=1 Tax=Dekkera bruxellensis TaxID=5007 RepID=A0A871RCV4_DEKBR|nr:uncharacterized protein BRETT_005068 [Brettanomyces bruxellensis]QOU20411.1 hypothetical protein BRETT_005068 [Brettanomyces bruxellensis]